MDGSGNVYVAGFSAATWGSPVRAYSSGNDAFAAKLSSSGALTWNTFLGGSGWDYGTGIAVDGSGNVYVAGYSPAAWGSPVRAFAADNDAFAAKLSSSGALAWHTFLGGDTRDAGNGIAVDTGGNVYIAGDIVTMMMVEDEPGMPPFPVEQSSDALVAKLNSSGSIGGPPAASFTKSLNPTSGVVPVTVTFTDTSGGSPTSWSWNFGDGAGSSSQNPARIYNTAGNYTVTLTASNASGSSSASQTINTYTTPVASFSKSASSGVAPLTVTFTDTSSGNIVSWSWSFGDGAGSSSQNPTKIYNTAGNYTVTLTATNPAGSNTSATQTVTVMSYKAETEMTIGLDTGTSNYVYISAAVKRFFNQGDGGSVTLADGIGGYDAQLTYSAGAASFKTSSGLAPFGSPTVSYDTAGGTRTTVVGSQTGGAPGPRELVRLYPWLTSDALTPVTITLRFNSISRGGGGTVPQDSDKARTFLRGDAKADGVVDITDAMFIAQYLAAVRSLGETTALVHPVNAATPLNDSATLGSTITITDALFIAQMLAGLRGNDYVLK